MLRLMRSGIPGRETLTGVTLSGVGAEADLPCRIFTQQPERR